VPSAVALVEIENVPLATCECQPCRDGKVVLTDLRR